MMDPLGTQLVDALHKVWVQVYGSSPRGPQWDICRLTMELNMEHNEKRTGEQVLESALSALGDSACAHTRKWVQGIRGLRSLTRGTVWDRATEAADQQRSLNGAQSDETTAVVLWWGSDEPPLPDKFQSGPDHSGRQWALARLLWRHGRTQGAVLTWDRLPLDPLTTRAWTRLRADIRDQILNEINKRVSGNTLETLEIVAKTHRCTSPICEGPQGHTCGLANKRLLPTSLNRLVDTLQLDCDLLADALHRCRRPTIKSWCSRFAVDKLVGAEGNALNVPLTGKRMLIHLPPAGIWKSQLGAKIKEALSASNDTLCLILSPQGAGIRDSLEPASLVLLGHSEAAGLGDPNAMYTASSPTPEYSGRMDLWVACRTPDHRHLRARWWEVKAAANEWQGFIPGPELNDKIDNERRTTLLLASILRTHARAAAMGGIQESVQAILETGGLARETARRQLRARLLLETAARMKEGESIAELATIANTHLLEMGRATPKRTSQWLDPPDADPKDEVSGWMSFVMSRHNLCGYVNEGWPPQALTARHKEARWILLWSRDRQQYCTTHDHPPRRRSGAGPTTRTVAAGLQVDP